MTDHDPARVPDSEFDASGAPVPDADPARRLILARRARFVAAALATAGIASASCNEKSEPGGGPGRVEVASPRGGAAAAGSTTGGTGGFGPEVCLSPPEPGTGGTYGPGAGAVAIAPGDTGVPDEDAGVRSDAGAKPQVCLL